MSRWIVWAPRVLGILVVLFVSAFALDAFADAQPLRTAFVDFAIHLVPAGILLCVVVLAWRWPWIGASAFIPLSIAYAIRSPRLDWTLLIAGPLLVVGLLFLWSWRQPPGAPGAA